MPRSKHTPLVYPLLERLAVIVRLELAEHRDLLTLGCLAARAVWMERSAVFAPHVIVQGVQESENRSGLVARLASASI